MTSIGEFPWGSSTDGWGVNIDLLEIETFFSELQLLNIKSRRMKEVVNVIIKL